MNFKSHVAGKCKRSKSAQSPHMHSHIRHEYPQKPKFFKQIYLLSACPIPTIKHTVPVFVSPICPWISCQGPSETPCFHFSWLATSLNTMLSRVPSSWWSLLAWISAWIAYSSAGSVLCDQLHGTFATLLVQSKPVQISISNKPEYFSAHYM